MTFRSGYFFPSKIAPKVWCYILLSYNYFLSTTIELNYVYKEAR
jgi:hypothetical protein